MRPDILVIGAGVSGMTTAVRLAEDPRRPRVHVLAQHRPERSTSAAAGAIWDPIYANHPDVPRWSARTYDVLCSLEQAGRPEVRLVDGVEASRHDIPAPGWARALPGFRECVPADLPPGFRSGWCYRAPIVDMPPYLAYLERRLAAAGATVGAGRLESLDEVLVRAPVVVNCSGIGARELVPDPEVTPIRGQLVAVRNPGVHRFFAEHTDELAEMTYLLPQGNGVLLLGGSADKDIGDAVPDLEVARAIVERCAGVVPAVAHAEILGHRVGIRPQRPEIRLERVGLGGGRALVHNYGHSGAGVSLSWGCADAVAGLILDNL
ncbi:FAD-dependent oxidoreductase [Actinoplanes sp. N902-109]|uniref:FAD-dependent oxidoreductase n=1 Tax=Actinoplanes sp. (strain N902-109) TaxID=649831 RepID=UPI00032933F8|nr:FAD-dependent oxidoreductase [Actinoplanes sp. N902-109]AGL18320.1 D-amino acid oxidase [Actinoplanes sp. N902-109]